MKKYSNPSANDKSVISLTGQCVVVASWVAENCAGPPCRCSVSFASAGKGRYHLQPLCGSRWWCRDSHEKES